MGVLRLGIGGSEEGDRVRALGEGSDGESGVRFHNGFISVGVMVKNRSSCLMHTKGREEL